jgi:hypothetical protein
MSQTKQVNITVIHVGEVQKVPTKTGFYSTVELTYKNNSFQDKTESKKFLDFKNKTIFNQVVNLEAGTKVTLSMVKVEQYWEITGIAIGHDETADSNVEKTEEKQVAGTKPSGSGTWATAEERAAVQTYIIRQSSLGHAVEFAAGGEATTDYVLQVAAEFEAWVKR